MSSLDLLICSDCKFAQAERQLQALFLRVCLNAEKGL